MTTPTHAQTAKTVLAGGCFWCIEHDMEKLEGVVEAVSGYAGGSRPNPTYETYNKPDAANPVPHIEVIEVTYDPAKLSYTALLQAFVRHIDPTDGGGQFCDRGPGYRPAIFAASDTEKVAAETVLQDTATRLGVPVQVEILPAAPFWPAEDYHQDYAKKNPVRYNYYRWGCGRDARIKAVWGAMK